MYSNFIFITIVMGSPENVSSQERVESNQESQEQLASQKFDEIFYKLHGNTPLNEEKFGENGFKIQKEGNIQGYIQSYYNPNSGYKAISIEWEGEGKNNSSYSLIKQNGKFRLEYRVGDVLENPTEKVLENITPEELINKILPNFKKRISEGEILRTQSRQKDLEDANQYAYQQDQQDADRLLQENGLA